MTNDLAPRTQPTTHNATAFAVVLLTSAACSAPSENARQTYNLQNADFSTETGEHSFAPALLGWQCDIPENATFFDELNGYRMLGFEIETDSQIGPMYQVYIKPEDWPCAYSYISIAGHTLDKPYAPLERVEAFIDPYLGAIAYPNDKSIADEVRQDVAQCIIRTGDERACAFQAADRYRGRGASFPVLYPDGSSPYSAFGYQIVMVDKKIFIARR